MRLTGKTRAEIDALLGDRSRDELVGLIFSLVSFDRLLTAREIAEASHVAKRDVISEMRAGRFVDPMFGAGFFCRAGNSLRVSASAANAWRESFFVPVPLEELCVGKRPDLQDRIYIADQKSIAAHKKNPARETDLDGKKSAQKGPPVSEFRGLFQRAK
jgi:hypothetical protein